MHISKSFVIECYNNVIITVVLISTNSPFIFILSKFTLPPPPPPHPPLIPSPPLN